MRIGVKLNMGAVILIAAVVAVFAYSVHVVTTTLCDAVGRNAAFVAGNVLQASQAALNRTVTDLKRYCADPTIQTALVEANAAADRVADVGQLYRERDEAWANTPAEHDSPFMRQIIDHPVSQVLREDLLTETRLTVGDSPFAEVFVTDRYGGNVCQTDRTSDFLQSDEEWWHAAQRDGVFIGDVEFDESSGVYGLNIAVRVDDEDGEFLGILKAVLDASDLLDKMRENSAGHGGDRLEIVSGDGRVLYASTPFTFLNPHPEWVALRNSPTLLGYISCGQGEAKDLLAFARDAHSSVNRPEWTVLIRHDYEKVMAPVLRLRNRIGILACLVVFIGLLGASALRSSIVRPVNQLAAGIRDMEMGAFHHSALASSNDEIGMLASAFNSMAEYRALAEERMRSSEEWHRVLFETSRDAIMTLEPPSWGFTSGNAATLSVFGAVDEKELLANGPGSLSPELQPDGRASGDKAMEMIETAMREGSCSFEWTHSRLDGEEFPATVLLTRMEVGGRAFLQATVRDITELKQAEKELQAVGEQLRAVLESVGIGIAVISPDMEILSLNRQMREWFPDVDPGRGVICYRNFNAPARPSPCTYCPTIITLRDGEVHEAVTDTPSPHGVIHFRVVSSALRDPAGRVIGAVEMVEDITPQRRAEEALRDSEERYRILFEGAAEGILVADAETRRFRYANSAICDLLGYSVEEITGMDVQSIHPEESLPEVSASFEAQARGEIRLAPELPCLRKNGEIVYADINTSRVEIGGRPCLVGFFSDVTERRNAEVERRALEIQLRRQQKMAAVGTLAGGAGHELNNPINGIMNYAQLILDGLEPDGPLAEFADQIIVETERIASITRGLAAFASDDDTTRARVNIGDLMESKLASIHDTLAIDGIITEVDIPDDMPGVMCNGRQIEQILTALMSNARDALNEKYEGHHEDKKIIISARSRIADDPDQLVNVVRITVEDHGAGIPEDQLERVFDPFFTTKDRAVGAGSIGKGMGLFVSYATAQEHGGSLSLESKKGEWTRFDLDLPIDGGNRQ